MRITLAAFIKLSFNLVSVKFDPLFFLVTLLFPHCVPKSCLLLFDYCTFSDHPCFCIVANCEVDFGWGVLAIDPARNNCLAFFIQHSITTTPTHELICTQFEKMVVFKQGRRSHWRRIVVAKFRWRRVFTDQKVFITSANFE